MALNRTDSFYAVSKITSEALGFLYAHKHGLTVIAIRLGRFRPIPWPRDGWGQLDYHPADTATDHELPSLITDRWHGGTYVTDSEPFAHEPNPHCS